MILVDHIAGDPLSRFSYQHLGFSDAAEIFVFLSGLACGIAYSRTLARHGWGTLLLAITKRATRIYVYYAISNAIVILGVMAAATAWHIDPHGDGFAIQGNQIATEIRLMLLLESTPAHSEVLVLYLMLTLIAIPSFLLGGDRYSILSLAVSGIVWLCSPWLVDMSSLVEHWFFDPFAWQFLFVIGMFFGVKWDRRQPALQLLGRLTWLLPAAWSVVVLAFAYKILVFFSSDLNIDPAWLRIESAQLTKMKQHLALIRLCHFLSVTVLVTTYVRSTHALMRTHLILPIVWIGKNPLQIFSLTIVLSSFGNVEEMVFHPNVFWRLTIDALFFALMGLAAYAMSRPWRQARRDIRPWARPRVTWLRPT
jgi:hypothetical protein